MPCADGPGDAAALYGEEDRILRVLERDLGVDARARGNEVRLVGDAEKVELARKVLEELYGVVRSGGEVRTRDVRQAVRMVTEEPDVNLGEVYEDILSSVGGRRRIKAKNLNQRLKSLGKPVKATGGEVAGNVRSRSAIMRVAEKIA